MAAINFVKGEQYYTAEFKINGPVNIHIERAKAGGIYIRQKSVADGKYVLINSSNWITAANLTIDTAIQGVVYPMWIKIESASEPTLAEMVEGEQSGGGAGNSGGGNENTYEYIKLTKPEGWAGDDFSGAVVTPLLMVAALLGKVEIDGSMRIMTPYIIGIQQLIPIAIAYDPNMLVQAETGFMKVSEIIQMFDLSSLPHLTKEQFYNLEA